MYTIQVDTGERLRLAYRRAGGEAARQLEASADRASTALDSTRGSVRMLGRTAPSVGYIHLWNLLSPETVKIFERALSGELRSARSLVLDLRGRGGQVPVLTAIAKRVEEDGRPTAVLIDDLARSAKEVLAYMLKGKKNITLVGDTTAGAVRAAGYVTFDSQVRVMLPVNARIQIERLTGGIDLEGRGVRPDVFVDFQLPYLAGRDPILERAITLLNGAPQPARRRRL
jgi:carboxyl-terminal processing protease